MTALAKRQASFAMTKEPQPLPCRVLLQAWQDRLHKHRTWSLIDLDSFGSSGGLLAMAVAAVEDGGLLYATCTDGLASGGRQPAGAA